MLTALPAVVRKHNICSMPGQNMTSPVCLMPAAWSEHLFQKNLLTEVCLEFRLPQKSYLPLR